MITQKISKLCKASQKCEYVFSSDRLFIGNGSAFYYLPISNFTPEIADVMFNFSEKDDIEHFKRADDPVLFADNLEDDVQLEALSATLNAFGKEFVFLYSEEENYAVNRAFIEPFKDVIRDTGVTLYSRAYGPERVIAVKKGYSLIAVIPTVCDSVSNLITEIDNFQQKIKWSQG